MRLSRKADYALRVMFTLVDGWGQGPVSMTTLAKTNDVPKRFLEHIMLDLKSKGWVESSPGRAGGYFLAVPPEEITLGQIVRHFDGILAPVGCVSLSDPQPCSQSASCRFRRVMLEIRNLTARHMDTATLAQVAGGQPVAETELLKLGFTGGGGI
jgi:Rrf2 family protein